MNSLKFLRRTVEKKKSALKKIITVDNLGVDFLSEVVNRARVQVNDKGKVTLS